MKRFSKLRPYILSMLCSLGMIHVNLAHAQDEKFTATSSSSSVAVGEQFQVTFSFSGNGKGFKAPDFQGFSVLMGPSQSSSVQIINGNFSQTISFTYVLQAIKEGNFKIAGAEITGSSGKVISNSLSIQVTKSSSQPSTRGQGAQDGGNVFLRATVDKNNVLLGEAVVLTYRLYTKVSLLNYSLDKIPSMNGFWSQDIEMPQQLNFRQENLDGVSYNVADLKKVVLFPQRSGNLQIEPMTGEVIARIQVKRQTRSNDPLDQFFNDPFFSNPFNSNLKDVKIPLKSESIRINVRELPSGAPASFGGAVGEYSYSVTLDRNEVKAHEPVSLKIKISGKGNIKLVEAPQINFPPDFETYDPKESTNLTAATSGVSGSKTFEYLLIPRNAGEYKISVADFGYFDIVKKTYQEIPSPQLTVKVLKGEETGVITGVSGITKSDIQLLGKDIRFIKLNEPQFILRQAPLYGSGIFYTLLGAPALIFAGMLLLRKRNETLSENKGLLKSRRATKIAMKRLSAAKKLLNANEKEKFLDEVSRAMWGFISDKLQIPVADLSKESASDKLKDLKVDELIINKFTQTIDECEFARFARTGESSNENLYKNALDSITSIEESAQT